MLKSLLIDPDAVSNDDILPPKLFVVVAIDEDKLSTEELNVL